MATTRTRGISLEADGSRIINKVHKGERIFLRLGKVSQDEAEQRLADEIRQRQNAQHRRTNARPLFADCAARYLTESQHKRTAELLAYHITILLPFIGTMEISHVHDATLDEFKDARRLDGVSPTTINRTLEVVRTILNRAARAWRDEAGQPWLLTAPPLITMEQENRRAPHPLSWEEQDTLMPLLPLHLQNMILFAINSGLRDENICGLRWSWETPIPEAGRSVFIIPSGDYKTAINHVVILNDDAWHIIEQQRAKINKEDGSAEYVFTYSGHRVDTMNNNGWQNARAKAGLQDVRIHDLRHTYASRLRLAGVPQEDRNALMGHQSASIPEHYASADIGRLIELSNKVLDRQGTRTLLRVVNG